MGKFVFSTSFHYKISSICKRKMPQIDPELSKTFKVFVVLDAISVQFPKDFVLSSNKINSTTKERAMNYIFEENVAAVCFKYTSEWLQRSRKNSTAEFCATWILFESICCQTVGKRSSKKTELVIQNAFKGIFADFGWKIAQIDRKCRKCRKYRKFCQFLTFSVNFSVRLENFDKIKTSKSARW